MTRTIGCKVWFDWGFNGSYTDETGNLVSVSGEMRFNLPEDGITGSQGVVDSCIIELRNTSGRYSPLNTSGALYAYIQNGGAYRVPVYVETTINGSTYTRVFTGVTKLPRETGRTWDEIPTVRFECRGVEELYLQSKLTTPHADMIIANKAGWQESDHIAEFLDYAGVTTSSVDAGLVTIPWAYLDEESVIEEVWSLAAAGLGRFYASANGTLTYENNFHWLTPPHTTSQKTYTASDWENINVWYDDSQLYNIVSVEYSGRTPDVAGVLWEPDEPVQVPAGGTVNIIANFSQAAFSVEPITYKAHNIGGVDITDDITVNTIYASQRAAVQIINGNSALAATVHPLQIVGRPLRGSTSAEVTRNSASHGANGAFFFGRGDRTRTIGGNFYIQTRAQAGMIAQYMLDQCEYPRLRYELRSMPGDAARRPGDRITISDSTFAPGGRDAYVLGVSWRYGGMSYTMDIDAIDAANMFRGYGTGDPYFIIGTNKLGSASGTDTGKTWY